MKRGTDLKLKFRLLQRKLSLSSWETKGLLQTLWDFTAENAQRGDVGRFSDDELAAGIDWDRCPSAELVEALVSTRWLDAHPDHRLVVHNWHAHCEDWVLKRVHRANQSFASLPPDHPGQPMATNGRRCPPTADSVRQRPPIGALPGPGPGPGPVPDPGPGTTVPAPPAESDPPKPRKAGPPQWALDTADHLIGHVRKAKGGRIPPRARHNWAVEIAKLRDESDELAEMVPDPGDHLRIAIDWLFSKANTGQGRYALVVRCGSSLREKWPRIVEAARRVSADSPEAVESARQDRLRAQKDAILGRSP